MNSNDGIARLHVRIEGEGDGTPFVWAHGLLSSMAAEDATGWYDWPATATATAAASATAAATATATATATAAGMRLIRYDALGHGQSAPPESPAHCEWRALADDMLTVARDAGATNFIAGGASMGGMTALEAALKSPERLRALVLVSPPSLWEARVTQKAHYQTVARAGRVAGGAAMATWMAATVSRTFTAFPAPAMAAILAGVDVGVRNIAGPTLWALLRGAAQSDLPPREALSALATLPTLIVAWDGDATHPLASAEELHRLLPASQLFIARDHAQFTTIGQRIRQFVTEHSRP